MKVVIEKISDITYGDPYQAIVYFAFINGSSTVESTIAAVPLTGVSDTAGLILATEAVILDYANNTQSYGISAADFIWVANTGPKGLTTAPQAAITNAPADAVTNYNVVTTLLGSLTGALNTANTKQNDIATKLNTLLSELRTLGLISA